MEETYIVSARKYRPSTFSSVVGQKALTATLRNAILTNRLAHAYLFCGSRGVGKTTCARIFAKTINCSNPTPEGDPCNRCDSCRDFNENRSMNIIELDAASNNSVDNIRELTDQVMIPPVNGRYRVFIVDEVHMLSTAAFNAFLKTLEEPPAHAIFILATTEKHKIIPTILSRCQIYDFKRITITDIIDHLGYVASQEGYTAERQALGVIARKADGAMRDALSIFDQVAASSRGNITYQATIDNLNVLDERYYLRLVEDFVAGNVPDALLTYKEIRDRGFDSYFFLGGLAGFLRDLMVARDRSTIALLDTDDETRLRMAETAAKLPPQFYYSAMSLCNEADMDYRTAASKTFLIELLLIRLCQLHSPSPASEAAPVEGQLKPIVPAAPTAAPSPAAPVSPAVPVSPAAPAAPLVVAAPPVAPARPAAPVFAPAPQTPARPSNPPASMPVSAVPPAPSAPRVPQTSGSGRGRKQHVSMSDAFSEPKAAATSGGAVADVKLRAVPFSDEQLLQAWEGYIALNPKAHVLINTMRACRPARSSADSHILSLTVANQPQVDTIEQEKPGLLKYLRNTLRNDYIDLHACVAEGAEIPAAWKDSDVLRSIIEHNPHAADFIAEFKLTLS